MNGMALQLPFSEKYRPARLEELVGNTECVRRLINYRDSACMPNLILVGARNAGHLA